MKPYKAIFFDWDGTCVTSRKASVEEAVKAMVPLLEKGIKLIIVSGTTYENIAGGRLHEYFTPKALSSLWLGLGRGAYDYRFDENGLPYIWKDRIPSKGDLMKIHDAAYEFHRLLLECCDYPTDIVFSRPNYCKIDLMVDSNRGEQLFLQADELTKVKNLLKAYGIQDGLKGMIKIAEEIYEKHQLSAAITTDAKYLEMGITSKTDNINSILSFLMEKEGLFPYECAFWGDEYIGIEDGLFGSDSYMITPLSSQGDFFDVSETKGVLPDGVTALAGGPKMFLDFLEGQILI